MHQLLIRCAGSVADLSFRAVVKRCESVLLVTSTVQTLVDASFEGVLNAGGVASAVMPDYIDRAKVGLLRMWCCVELHAARAHHIPVVMVAGTRKGHTSFKADWFMLCKLLFLVDLESSVSPSCHTIVSNALLPYCNALLPQRPPCCSTS